MKKFCALLAVVALVAFAAPAFASNPFMDVPMNHWAYDAVGQLAARGIVSGYPDGTYKGNQPITRYEMASVIARGLAVIDMDKASKQDVEMLKRLVVEFKDELDALGVKVDKIDSRVSVLEENIGGWKFWGQFRFDARFTGGDGRYLPNQRDTDFNVSRYRIWMKKQVDDKVTFTARLGGEDIQFDRYWVDVKLPWDVNMMVGKWFFDWEDDDGLYAKYANDAFFTDRTLKGFYFSKSFGMGQVAAYVAHGTNGWDIVGTPVVDGANFSGYEFGARARFNFNETFWLSLNAILVKPEFDAANASLAPNVDLDVQNLWAAFAVNFNPNIALKVAYYDQKLDAFNGWQSEGSNFRAILDVKQDALKFTSLWLEYNSFNDNFTTINGADPWGLYGGNPFGQRLGARYDSLVYANAEQKWNDKWTTYVRYGVGSANNGVNSIGGFNKEDTKNYGVGVRYFYTPATMFELTYDKIEDRQGVRDDSDNIVRFRTLVSF